MANDLPQRYLVNGIDPDRPRLSGSPDRSGREAFDECLEPCTEHNDESFTSSNQIGGAINAFIPLPQFSNQGPGSAAVNGGELMIGGIQLYDGGVGHGDGIGNGFGANDQEPSYASINSEPRTTYVGAGDYFSYVGTENGDVHFHMNSFANVDGRVYNRTQDRQLNNLGSSQLINKVMLAITGQTGIALMVAANGRSSPFPLAFYVVVVANIVGFITTMISMLLRTRKPWASGVLAKMGAVAGSSAIILAMGMTLHMRHTWVFLFLCIITAVAVLFGQT